MKHQIIRLNKNEDSLIYLLGQEEYSNNISTNLILINDIDWNRDLSPWPSPRVFKKGQDFSGQADVFLNELLTYINNIEKDNDLHISKRGICGYSLAGLFSFYCLYKTDYFSYIGAVSASFWYPDFLDFVLNNKIKAKDPYIYLSLGDKEALSKNSILQNVETDTQIIYKHLKKQSYRCDYQKNPGGHFDDPPGRINLALKTITDNYT